MKTRRVPMGARRRSRQSARYGGVIGLIQDHFHILLRSSLVCLALACAAMGATRWFQQYPVRQVAVVAPFVYAPTERVLQLLQSSLANKPWMSVDVEQLRVLLSNEPWIQHVAVIKHWPDQIEVELIEPTPMAIWNEQWIMTTDGELIAIDGRQHFDGLPRLRGVDDTHVQASAFFQSINTLLRGADLQIVEYDCESALHWRLLLSSNVELVLAEDHYVDNVRRFLAMLSSLDDAQRTMMHRVDARYENGVAVEWKKAT